MIIMLVCILYSRDILGENTGYLVSKKNTSILQKINQNHHLVQAYTKLHNLCLKKLN